jgi:hypothetical protein
MKNLIRFLILTVLLSVNVFTMSVCPGQKAEGEKRTKSVEVVTIRNNIVGSLDVGIGWNDASVLDDRWMKHEFSQDDWDRYFGLMEWSGCHWLRHAVTITDWEPVNENEDPQDTGWKSFTFESEFMKRHYIFLDQAEKRGIKVLVTNWRLGAQWLTKQEEKWILAHPDNEEEFAEALAALIYHLKKNKNYQCVWALSLWNEPNGDWAYTGPKSKYPDSFWPLYQAVDRHLSRLGVRDEILMLGPDASTGGKPEHIPLMLTKYGSLLDIIGDHDYSAFRGERMDQSIAAYAKLMGDLKKIPGKSLPFVIGEFGNYGAGSKAVDDDAKVYDGALSTTAFLFRMLNHGAAGLARWEFHIYGDTWRNFGALTETDPDYVFKPYGPVFYPHAITSRYVKPGWKVRETWVEGNNDGIYATALTSPQDDITIMLLNDTFEPATILLKLELPCNHSILHHMSIVGPMPEGIDLHRNIRLEEKEIRIILPARSVTTLTSLPAGDLTIPEKLSLKR